MTDDETRRAWQDPRVELMDDGDVAVRRVYDEPADRDGTRVLVDRIWPRGLRKSEAHLDEWCKEVSPSTALRTWYGHDPAKFEEFTKRYRAELTEPQRAEALQHLRQLADVQRLTLLTGTKETGISQAAVIADVLSRDRSPEVVATAEPATTGGIVVGVDGSPGARAAMQWAMREARLRSCSVRAVMAWRYSPSYGDAWMWPVEGFDALTDCEQVLGSVVAEFSHPGQDSRSGPGVAMTAEAVQGHPGQSLLVAAAEAELLVVGSRGRGGLVGALLGSVSRHVVAHARCPVVVVPDPERRQRALET